MLYLTIRRSGDPLAWGRADTRNVAFSNDASVLASANGSVRVAGVTAQAEIDGMPKDAGSVAQQSGLNDRPPSASTGNQVSLRRLAGKVDQALRGLLSEAT